MTLKASDVVASALSNITSPPPARQPWPKNPPLQLDEDGNHIDPAPRVAARAPYIAPASEELDDMSFDGSSIRIARNDERPLTVADLQNSKNPIERTEERGSAPAGQETVSTAALVQQMIAQGGGQNVATASAAKPRRQRSATGGRRKQPSRGAQA